MLQFLSDQDKNGSASLLWVQNQMKNKRKRKKGEDVSYYKLLRKLPPPFISMKSLFWRFLHLSALASSWGLHPVMCIIFLNTFAISMGPITVTPGECVSVLTGAVLFGRAVEPDPADSDQNLIKTGSHEDKWWNIFCIYGNRYLLHW